MKTRELIRLLEEADPSGELECCIQNCDINFVDVAPAYYDGPLELLHRSGSDEKAVAASLTTTGQKVRIHALSIEDIIYDQPEFEIKIEVHDESLRARLERQIEEWRSAAVE